MTSVIKVDNIVNSGGDNDSGIDLTTNDVVAVKTADTERCRVDASGNLLVGKTAVNATDVGIVANANGRLYVTVDGSDSIFNRTSSDGNIISFRKDNTTRGAIGCIGDDIYIDGLGSSGSGIRFESNQLRPRRGGGDIDNSVDLGGSNFRFDDVFATNGTIQTSDQNEKQQIASLTSAEITAAKAISKLFKTFKWNSAVEAKGDAARTHTGVIAQQVETAMTDAGLDAGDYAFFISDTWTDDDGNSQTRKGIRYPELLSFVGAATEQRLADIETRLTALENA